MSDSHGYNLCMKCGVATHRTRTHDCVGFAEYKVQKEIERKEHPYTPSKLATRLMALKGSR